MCSKRKGLLNVAFHPENLPESDIKGTVLEICHSLRYSKASAGATHFIIDQGLLDCAETHVCSKHEFQL